MTETMGQRFRAARERKKMNISKAAALTRIKIQHLEMMENDDFSKMPAPTYAKGFIRIYAQFLGLDPAPLVQEYLDRHLNAVAEDDRPTRPAPRPSPARTASRTPPPAPAALEEELPETAPGPEPSAPRAPWTPPWRRWNLVAGLHKLALTLAPLLPRLLIAGVIALLLAGIVRCTTSMTSGRDDAGGEAAEMDPSAIMKEPPVRYLSLPAPEETTP